MAGLLERLLGLAAAETLGPDTTVPIEKGRYLVVDTELTGFDRKKDSIVSIGAIRMDGKSIAMSDSFYQVVSPRTELTAESVVVHGIMPSETESKPLIDKVLHEFLEYAKGYVIVGHYISLDLSFIGREVKRVCGKTLKTPAVDTMTIYEWMKEQTSGPRGHHGAVVQDMDLFSLARKYRIPVSGAHNALMDSFVTAQLFQRFLCSLPELGVKTVKDLLKIGRP
ncbi:MAG: 3'-5' exonuclease [Nitrospirae bacterium]|nr:MAG: 3'-5' exonuclease [Nitrospirota bacterium]